jgi:acyl transferase domain-containing protein
MLTGSDTAVHVGLMNSDYAERPATGSVYAATGARPSVAAGRISFVLGLMGPCTTIDTACSSALAAVDFSRLHLLGGHAASALAAAVNVILSPSTSVSFARAGMLSQDGRCKTFDARSKVYVRGEVVGGRRWPD